MGVHRELVRPVHDPEIGLRVLATEGSHEVDVQRLFAETKKAFGRLDILVNNAGIYNFAPLAEVTPTGSNDRHAHNVDDLRQQC